MYRGTLATIADRIWPIRVVDKSVRLRYIMMDQPDCLVQCSASELATFLLMSTLAAVWDFKHLNLR